MTEKEKTYLQELVVQDFFGEYFFQTEGRRSPEKAEAARRINARLRRVNAVAITRFVDAIEKGNSKLTARLFDAAKKDGPKFLRRMVPAQYNKVLCQMNEDFVIADGNDWQRFTLVAE